MLLSMNKNLKHIMVRGQMVARGKYFSGNGDIRPYEPVKLTDERGENVVFETMIIPRQLNEKIQLNQDADFYLLRFKNKAGKMTAALYAVEIAGEKYFYEEAAKKAIKMLRSSISLRAIFLRRPDISVLPILVSTFVVCLIVGSPILMMLGEVAAALSLAVAVPLWWYALIFPFVQNRKYMGIEGMDMAMKNGGFNSLIEVSENINY